MNDRSEHNLSHLAASSLSLTHSLRTNVICANVIRANVVCANVTLLYTLSKIGAQNANNSYEWLYMSC